MCQSTCLGNFAAFLGLFFFALFYIFSLFLVISANEKVNESFESSLIANNFNNKVYRDHRHNKNEKEKQNS